MLDATQPRRSPDGFTTEECCQVAAWLDREDIDLLEITGGTYERMAFYEGGGSSDGSATEKKASWFGLQVMRMGRGEDPNPQISLLKALFRYQRNEYRAAQALEESD